MIHFASHRFQSINNNVSSVQSTESWSRSELCRHSFECVGGIAIYPLYASYDGANKRTIILKYEIDAYMSKSKNVLAFFLNI